MACDVDFAPRWVGDAVFYQIFPDRFRNGDPANDPTGTVPWGDVPTRENFFGGDLRGIIDGLDYLEGLGVDAVYLNPIFKAQTNHRYDTSDYFSVDPALGDLAELRRLVAEMHRRGMRLILDGVFNHCGLGFAPFVDVAEKGAGSRYADWFVAESFPLGKAPLNYHTCGGCVYLPKLNNGSRAVQEYIFSVARYWLAEAGIDGFRLDVPFKMPIGFWREFRGVVKEAKPDAYLVGEVWREAGPWIGGDAFDGVTNYRLRDILIDYCLTGFLDAEDFGYELLTLLAAHGHAARSMLNLLGSHDTPRFLTLADGDAARLKIALTALFTLPGAPMIYYGDEVGLLGGSDPDCRRCMPWDEAEWNLSIKAATSDLIALRRSHAALRHGTPEILAAFNGVFAYKMEADGDEVIVVLNSRESVPRLRLPSRSGAAAWRERGKAEPLRPNADGELLLEVPARSARVLLPER